MKSNAAVIAFHKLFLAAPNSGAQQFIILLVAVLFIWMPQRPPIDWDLYTRGFWSDLPQTYLNNPYAIAPPWGLLLLLPYYLMGAAGSRALSVLVVGWLTYVRQWPLWRFFVVIFSPYFLLTMAKSNLDMFVLVLPVLMWERAAGRKWEGFARGLAVGLCLLKPQATLFLLAYLAWTSRKTWRQIPALVGTLALLLVPVSLIGTPPLLLQWVGTLAHPSAEYSHYWSINNISLVAHWGVLPAIAAVMLVAAVVFVLIRAGWITWRRDQTLTSLLLSAMFILPYASQQSISGGLAFVPSLAGYFVQWLGFGLVRFVPGGNESLPLVAFPISFLVLLVSAIGGPAREQGDPALAPAQVPGKETS